MNKVISINIGGSIFQVEENAYEKLNSYLNELKKHFSNKPEGNEIITDIENRIAELLRAKLNVMKAAINLDDVNEVTASMGAPKDFVEEEETTQSQEQKSEPKQEPYNSENENIKNRVYRDPDGRIVGGVCSGLGHYFKVDPVWIRLFFVIVSLTSLKLIFFGASPVLIYIILWIVIPEAKTTAEKLQMRKEKINIDNIQKSVQSEFGKVRDAVQSPKFQDQATSILRRIFDLIKQIVLGVLNVLRHIGKAFLYFFSFIFLVMAIAALTGRVNLNNHGEHSVFNLISFFENNSDMITAQAAAFTVFLSLGLIALLLANGLSRNRFYGRTNFILRTTTILVSVIAIVLLLFSAVKVASYFAVSDKIETTIALDSAQHHYYIKGVNQDYEHSFPFFLSGDTLRVKDIEVYVEYTDGPSQIEVTTKAYGQNHEIAKLNASAVMSMISIHDSIIAIPESFNVLSNKVYRKQELRYKIKLHKGTQVTIEDDYWRDIFIKTEFDNHRASTGRTYMITEKGIDCIDCSKMYTSVNVNISSYPLNIDLHGHEFSQVHVESDINVKVVKGSQFMIRARGTSNEDHLDIDYDGSLVTIGDNRKWNLGLLNDWSTIEVLIVMPEISKMELSGIVQGQLEGFDEDELRLELSGTSTCLANVMVRDLKVEQDGASKLTVDGKASSFQASVEGASKLYAANMRVKTADLHVSGASYAEINVEESLNANASGASNIRYKGEVHDVRTKNSGASSVELMK